MEETVIEQAWTGTRMECQKAPHSYALDFREIPVSREIFESWKEGSIIYFKFSDENKDVAVLEFVKRYRNDDDWSSAEFYSADNDVTVEIIDHGREYDNDDWLGGNHPLDYKTDQKTKVIH